MRRRRSTGSRRRRARAARSRSRRTRSTTTRASAPSSSWPMSTATGCSTSSRPTRRGRTCSSRFAAGSDHERLPRKSERRQTGARFGFRMTRSRGCPDFGFPELRLPPLRTLSPIRGGRGYEEGVECLRGQLTEQPPVSRRELPGVPEAPALGDLVDGRRVRGGLQLLTDCIEPNRLEIGHRAQAADLLERMVQRPLAYGQFPTKVEHGHRLPPVRPQVIFGAANQPRPVGGLAGGPVVVRSSKQPDKTSEALL